MSTPRTQEVLEAVRAELAQPDHGVGHLEARLQGLRWSIEKFRAEPVGGRLRPLKSFVYWFVASAFDRQTKLLEETADLLAEVIDEMDHAVASGDTTEKPDE